ncbi:MAG: hypothetical protein K8H89_06020 [Flavobacteriales bacterium]|jgi:uncharacterized protein YjiK|nr:hypothetical protein [Flavobacteriales bacterium]MCB0759827.1 hypothetical protein [Flavobacteriales bacterium]
MRLLIALALLLSPQTGGLRHPLPEPASIVELPSELLEVSGLTDLDQHTVACLQDEDATLYVVDIRDGRILERHPFGPPGDMEGLTRVKDGLFALRSDGLIYHLRIKGAHYTAVDSFRMELGHRNIEGLGYDEHTGLVLVAPKDVLKGEPQIRDQRSVFAFDPATRKVLPEPVLTYSVQEVMRQAEAGGMKLPTRTTRNGRIVDAIKLRMASIAVDPVSDHYFLLSAVDQTLLVLDRQGAFVALHLLDADLLPKPEGITFLPNGDMLIATEGKNGPPRLVRYALTKEGR